MMSTMCFLTFMAILSSAIVTSTETGLPRTYLAAVRAFKCVIFFS